MGVKSKAVLSSKINAQARFVDASKRLRILQYIEADINDHSHP